MPLVSQTFDQLLDFTRTTSGTFVGSNGLIQNTAASRNLLTWTQQFDNAAWTKSNATVTANATTAPDGTTTADTLIENTATGTHVTFQVFTFVAATTYTYSAYVKANGRTKFDFASLSGFSPGASFDLTAVTATPLGATSAATITAVGNGWYRCTATRTSAGGSDQAQIRLVDAAGASTYTGDGTSGIYLWGAQLEAASAASTYTRNNGGVFPPRFDYDPVTLAAKGLLIEEQRTNLLLRSEEFDTTWTGFVATVSSNAAVSPDGTTDADKIIPDNAASLGSSGVTQTVTAAAATYTYSVYAKIGEYNRVRLLVRDSASAVNNASVIVSLVDGTITTAAAAAGTFTGASATVIAAGNGFYRVSLTLTSTGASSLLVRAFVDDSVATTGNGTSGIFLYGAQLEAGSFATSYIPTVASQVTRTADNTSIVAPNFAPWYNQSEGTFVASFDSYLVDLNTRSALSAYASGATSNNILLMNTQQRQFQINNAGNQADLDGGTPTSGTVTQVAGAYKVNDFALSLNGGTVVTDTSGTVPTVDTLGIGISPLSLTPINGHISSIRYYPTRLSDAQLQALTA